MKKIIIAILLSFSVLGFAQKTKKKTYKKKPVKKTYAKKAAAPKVQKEEVKEEQIISTEVIAPVEVIPIEQTPDYEIIANKILQKNGSIKNRNSAYVRGIEGFVKGIYVQSGKLYVLLEIANRTNINYDVESASFITSPIQKKNRQIEIEEKVYTPVYSNQPEAFTKKSTKKVVYVFDKFNISDNKTLLFIMSEIDGERTLTLEIKPKFIIEADYIK